MSDHITKTEGVLTGTDLKSVLAHSYPAWLAAFCAFVIYFLTASPTISWQHNSSDSGELAACAATLGIVHPPGYPLYTLVNWCIISLFRHVDPAWVMVLFSVFCGSIAVGVLSKVSALTVKLLDVEGKVSGHASGWIGALAGLMVAVSPLLWTQSIIIEVYSLAILLQSVVWLLVVKYLERVKKGDGSEGRLIIRAGLVMGFILAHQTGGGSVLLPMIVVLIMTWKPERVGQLLKALPAVIPGLLFYLYLPLRSARNPGIDFGNPESAGNFLSMVSARLYRPFMFSTPPGEFFERILDQVSITPISVAGAILVLSGIVLFILLRRSRTVASLGIATGVYILWTWIFATGYHVGDYEVFYYSLIAPAVVLLGAGIYFLTSRIRHKASGAGFVVVLIIVIAVGMRLTWNTVDMSKPGMDSAPVYTFLSLTRLEENSMVVAGLDMMYFPLLYGKYLGINIEWTGESLPPRNDIDVFQAQFIQEGWFYENLEGSENWDVPVLVVDPEIEDGSLAMKQFIELNMVNRPVYIDDQTGRMLEEYRDDYKLTKMGGLWRVEDKMK